MNDPALSEPGFDYCIDHSLSDHRKFLQVFLPVLIFFYCNLFLIRNELLLPILFQLNHHCHSYGTFILEALAHILENYYSSFKSKSKLSPPCKLFYKRKNADVKGLLLSFAVYKSCSEF